MAIDEHGNWQTIHVSAWPRYSSSVPVLCAILALVAAAAAISSAWIVAFVLAAVAISLAARALYESSLALGAIVRAVRCSHGGEDEVEECS